MRSSIVPGNQECKCALVSGKEKEGILGGAHGDEYHKIRHKNGLSPQSTRMRRN